jgi:hypothetical protein
MTLGEQRRKALELLAPPPSRHEKRWSSQWLYEDLKLFNSPLAPRELLRFFATTDPSATLSPSIDFPVGPVIRSTLLR